MAPENIPQTSLMTDAERESSKRIIQKRIDYIDRNFPGCCKEGVLAYNINGLARTALQELGEITEAQLVEDTRIRTTRAYLREEIEYLHNLRILGLDYELHLREFKKETKNGGEGNGNLNTTILINNSQPTMTWN